MQLDSDTLAKLASLQLRVRRVVEGTMAGLHRSPHRGSSIEFAEHKEYCPGDDLRRLDWKAYARFDRYYIREHEDETELKAYLVLDCSGSMGYGEPLTKLQYGSVLAGALAYLLGVQRDQPGLLAFGQQVRCYVPPRSRRGQSAAVLSALDQLQARGGTALPRAISQLMELGRRRSVVVIISDMLDVDQGVGRLLRQLRARGHQVVLFQLLHRDETQFPFEQVMQFQGMEDDRRELLVDPAGVRQVYLREMQRFCDGISVACREAQVTYRRVTTDEPLDRVLVELLRGQIR